MGIGTYIFYGSPENYGILPYLEGSGEFSLSNNIKIRGSIGGSFLWAFLYVVPIWVSGDVVFEIPNTNLYLGAGLRNFVIFAFGGEYVFSNYSLIGEAFLGTKFKVFGVKGVVELIYLPSPLIQQGDFTLTFTGLPFVKIGVEF